MKIAINTNAYRDLTYEDAVAQIARDAPGVPIEASTCREHLYEYFIRMERMRGLEDIPMGNVVVLSGGWADFVTGEGLECEGIMDRQVAFSCLTDIPVRIFFSNPIKEAPATMANMREGIWNLGSLVQRWLGDCNPRLCVENHAGLTREPQAMNFLISQVRDHTHTKVVGTTLDPANYAMCGVDPMVATRAILPEFIYHVHVKDIDGQGEFCAPGRGQLKKTWKEIIKYLKSIGYNGVLTYEYEGHDIKNRQQHIVDGLNFLRELI